MPWMLSMKKRSIPISSNTPTSRRITPVPGKYRGGSGLTYGVRIHNTPGFYMQTFGLASRFPTNAGLFGGYAANVRPGIRGVGGQRTGAGQLPASPAPRNEFELLRLADSLGKDLQLTPVQGLGAIFKEGEFVGTVGLGAAGYGDVLEREPEAVAEDVAKGIISRWTA